MKPFWIVFIVLCAAGGGGYYWWQQQSQVAKSAGGDGKVAAADAKSEKKGAGKKGRGGPISVRTVAASRQPMPVVIDAVGSVESEHSVAIRPQASGTLVAVMFKEGDPVKKGQALFQIDARPMQAAVEQSRAAVTRDEAQLVQAKAQEARLRPLMEKDYITRLEYDVAATAAKSLEATVTANRAALEQARLLLSYSQIQAPISGRTGNLSVKAGNLVASGTGGAPLVVINSTQPILVSLSVPQRYLGDVRKHWGSPDLKVDISPDSAGAPVAQGRLVFIDNSVNPTTGTILLKAHVKNEKEELWPGQFVAARITLRVEPDALVLPESAVQPGQDGPFVYVVKDGRARVQNVKVDRQVGEHVVIVEGLSGGEEVVSEAPPSLTGGSAVVVRKPGEGGKAGEGKGERKSGRTKDKEAPAKETTEKEAKQ